MDDLVTRIETINPDSSEAIVLFFSTKYSVEHVQAMYEIVQKKFPNNTVVALPEAMSLRVFTRETLVKWLETIIEGLKNEQE